MVLADLRRRWHQDEGRNAFGGRRNEVYFTAGDAPVRVVLLEPHTYMNCSGRAVREMMTFYKADCRNLLVVLDDLALPLGRIRARAGGSAGGHKGLGDIQRALGTDEVPRLRIGIGAPPPEMDAADYVLSRFRPDEVEPAARAVDRAARAVEDWVRHGLTYAMDRYNPKPQDPAD
jgi:PTH1 family peptidyl-tRNA hydrolase